MKVHSISKVLATPLIIAAVGIMYISYQHRTEASILIFIPVVLLVLLYVFHGPLDHWWQEKFPLALDPRLKSWLSTYFPPYQKFDEADRKKFEYRLVLYLNGRLFQSVGSELKSVPEDIKCMVAAHAIELGLYNEDYLIGDMDRIYLYKHPFPSPNLPFLHTVEVHVEDGVILFSLEQLTGAIFSSDVYYNIAYHAYAEAFIGVNPDIQFPNCENTWHGIENVSGWNQMTIQSQTGLKDINMLCVHVTLFYSKNEKYRLEFPERYRDFDRIFKMNSSVFT